MKIILFIIANKEVIAAGLLSLYEIVVRLYPTKVNKSIFDAVKYFLDLLVPNRKIDGGLH